MLVQHHQLGLIGLLRRGSPSRQACSAPPRDLVEGRCRCLFRGLRLSMHRIPHHHQAATHRHQAADLLLWFFAIVIRGSTRCSGHRSSSKNVSAAWREQMRTTAIGSLRYQCKSGGSHPRKQGCQCGCTRTSFERLKDPDQRASCVM